MNFGQNVTRYILTEIVTRHTLCHTLHVVSHKGLIQLDWIGLWPVHPPNIPLESLKNSELGEQCVKSLHNTINVLRYFYEYVPGYFVSKYPSIVFDLLANQDTYA